MKKPYVITIDKDVPAPTEGSAYRGHEEKLKAMQEGDSFFIPGAEVSDLSGLLSYADSIEVPLIPIRFQQDEVYLTSGVRVWRNYHIEPATLTEFVDQKLGQVATALGISKKELKADVEKPSSRGARYWHHPESFSVFAVAGNEPDPVVREGSGELEKIDLDEYMRLSKEYNTASFEKKVDETPENLLYVGKEHQSWWKLKSGKMVEAPFEQYEKMQQDKTATRVAYGDYRIWKERQDEEL